MGFFSRDNPEAESQRSYAHALPMACNSTLPARNFFGLLPKGYCERKSAFFFEKTTFSVQSVLLLIYGQEFYA